MPISKVLSYDRLPRSTNEHKTQEAAFMKANNNTGGYVSVHGRLTLVITGCLLHGTADQDVKAFTRLILRTAVTARYDMSTVIISSTGDYY